MAGDEKRTKVVIDGDSKGGEVAFANMSSAAKKVQGEVSSLNTTLDTLRVLLATGGIVAAVNSSINAANQMEKSNIALATTARYVGEDMREVTSAAKELTKDGLMSVTEASQALQNLLSRGYGLQESIDLMNRLKDAAAFNRQSHLEFGQSIVGATEGLKNENSVLVDNAGVTKNVSVMWKEYAAQLGKSVDNLSQAEKRQAEYNGIMKETEGQVGNAVRMADTFSGAQARINQQWFEAKAAFGSGLQPVLKATLDLMTPVIRGLRDMVYWVETLGPRAAATIDKIKVAKDIAFSGVGLFSEKGLAEYDRRTAPINAALDETIAEIVRRADGETLPDIGADSGNRRKDTVIPGKPGKKPRELEGLTLEKLADYMNKANALEAEREYGSTLADADAVSFMNAMRSGTDMSWQAKPQVFSLFGAATGGFNQSGGDAYRKEVSDRYQTLQQGLMTENELIHQEYTTRMDLIREAENAGVITTVEAAQARTRAEAAAAEERQQIEQRLNETKTNMQVSFVNNAVGLLNVFGTKNKVAALAALTLQKGLAIGQTWVSGKAAEIRALAELGPVAGSAMAGTIKTWTLANIGMIAATGIAQAAMSGGNTSGGGTYSSPIVTQPAATTDTSPRQTVILKIEGNVISDDRWVEDRLAPTIRELVGRNVKFGLQREQEF